MNKSKLLIRGSIIAILILILIVGGVFLFNKYIINKLPIQPPITLLPFPKYCDTTSDCVPVGCRCHCSGCGGFSYEDVVNKDYVDKWYDEHNCSPARVCPEVCCTPVVTACEDNSCKVKARTRETLPKERLEKEAVDKKLCSRTGGIWNEGPIWDIGFCQCKENQDNPEKYFDLGKENFIDGRGCIGQRQLCDESGGLWKKPDVWTTEKRKDIPKDKCISSSIYTLMKWDEENDLCILERINDPNPKCLK